MTEGARIPSHGRDAVGADVAILKSGDDLAHRNGVRQAVEHVAELGILVRLEERPKRR